MRITALILMTISLLLSCWAVVYALKQLSQSSRRVFTRTVAGLASFFCLYSALFLSLAGRFEGQVVEWIFSQWGFLPVFGLFAMSGLVTLGVNEAYKQGKKDGIR